MAAGVITVGRKQYASGLYWEVSPSGRLSQAAKEAARQPGNRSDYFATRAGDKSGRVPQFGLVADTPGFKSGIPSLAGCLANQQPGSWIGAFAFREGTAVVVIRDDLIVPDGDLFFDDESAARDHLYQEIAVGGFQRIFAPEAWGIPGADSMPLSLLLNDRADIRLHSVRMSQKARLGLIAGFSVLVLVMAGGWYYQKLQSEQEALRLQQMEAMRRKQEELARLLPIDREPVYPPPERKWEDQPPPLVYLDACQKALDKLNVGVSGWSLNGVACEGAALSARWSRTGEYSKPPEGSNVDDAARSAVRSITLDGIQPRGAEDLVDHNDITLLYLEQNWPGEIAKEPDDPPPPPPPGQDPKKWNPPPPPWVKRSFTFTVPMIPWIIPDFFTDLPGVIIQSVTMFGDGASFNNNWTIKGVIYENRN